MSEQGTDDERVWDAEKRDFVADTRDDVAAERDLHSDTRDTAADERDRLADARDAELDERERYLDSHAADLGLPPDRAREEVNNAAAERTRASEQREEARQQRDRRREEREMADADRQESNKRRQATLPTTGLAMAFAEIARYLFEADNFEDVLTRVAETAVSTVVGCDMASITMRDDDMTFRTLASTQPSAIEVDMAQYETNEGPCLDAITGTVVYAPSFPDPRWPTLAARPVDSGVQAVASFALRASNPGGGDPFAGSLNAYAEVPNAFVDEAREIGIVLAAHASIAAGAVGERDTLEQLGQSLHDALSSRDVIGQAKGILMERLRITPEDAFDSLRRSSQQLNVKLRDIAQQLAETGELTGGPQA